MSLCFWFAFRSWEINTRTEAEREEHIHFSDIIYLLPLSELFFLSAADIGRSRFQGNPQRAAFNYHKRFTCRVWFNIAWLIHSVLSRANYLLCCVIVNLACYPCLASTNQRWKQGVFCSSSGGVFMLVFFNESAPQFSYLKILSWKLLLGLSWTVCSILDLRYRKRVTLTVARLSYPEYLPLSDA